MPSSGSQGSICPYPGVLAQEAWDGAINLAHPDTPHAVLLCWNRGDSNSYPHMSSSRSRRLVLPGLSRLRSWRRVARRSPLAVRYSGTRALVALPSMAWSSYSPGLPLKVLQSRGAYLCSLPPSPALSPRRRSILETLFKKEKSGSKRIQLSRPLLPLAFLS